MMATCFVQPLDLVKTRMQMSGMFTGDSSKDCYDMNLSLLEVFSTYQKDMM